VSHLSDPDHYQHTAAPVVPRAVARRAVAKPRSLYCRGDHVTVIPDEADHWLLHMQRQVTVASEERPGGYLVRLDSVAPDAAIQGPIPAGRLIPGWVEADGRMRCDVRGQRP
jgi:hypothetical protein